MAPQKKLRVLIWSGKTAQGYGVFDLVGGDDHRDARIKNPYVKMLNPLFAVGKRAVLTEFAMRGYYVGV